MKTFALILFLLAVSVLSPIVAVMTHKENIKMFADNESVRKSLETAKARVEAKEKQLNDALAVFKEQQAIHEEFNTTFNLMRKDMTAVVLNQMELEERYLTGENLALTQYFLREGE